MHIRSGCVLLVAGIATFGVLGPGSAAAQRIPSPVGGGLPVWEVPGILPLGPAPVLSPLLTPASRRAGAPDHRWEGMWIGAVSLAGLFGVGGYAFCRGVSDTPEDCAGDAVRNGAIAAFCGGILGGLIGGLFPKSEPGATPP